MDEADCLQTKDVSLQWTMWEGSRPGLNIQYKDQLELYGQILLRFRNCESGLLV